MANVSAVPEGHPAIVPHIIVKDAAAAIEFYKKAFNAEEVSRMPTMDGQFIIHAELRIGGSPIYLNDEIPGMEGCVAPASLNGTTFAINLWTENVDELFDQAVKAGATASMPVSDMFWGDRYGRLYDPYGHLWAIAARKENLTPEQIKERAAAFFSQQQ